MAEEITYARLDGTISKLRIKLSRLSLLIIDDFALSPMKKQELVDLFEVIEDRTGQASTVTIAQRSLVEWYGYIGDPLLADAFMDRIRSRAHLLQLEGKSMRQ